MVGSSRREKDELRILTPIGMLGQGFSEKVFWDAINDEKGIDAMIMDSGSTDSGPGRLATGSLSLPQAGFERDLALLVRACHLHHIPVLIGSAGGNGENKFVDLLIDIIRDLVQTNGYRPLKVIGIYSEIDKDFVRQKLATGLISPCGGGVPDLTEHDIQTATRIVAQMGHEPYLKAMEENPDFDIIIGGRAYDPSPYAAFCLYKGFPNMATNYAMGKILECGALCSLPKSREALAIVSDDYFDVKSLDPKSHVTTTSVAAHFLYEKSRPDILKGPGGALNLSNTTYEQIGYNHVRVRGAEWEPEPEGEYTLKIEGARTTGYFTTFLGAFRDPILISQLDAFLGKVQKIVKERMGDVSYDLKIHRYGIDGVMGPLETDHRVPKEVCVVVQARAASQKTANEVASGCKFAFTHLPYEGQVATAGNFAWPFTPCEMPGGPLSEFCIYHIMHKCHPTELTPINVVEIQGTSTYVALPISKDKPLSNGSKSESAKGHSPNAGSSVPTKRKYYLQPEPEPGTCYLADIASVIRSKNAGPYELTFDVMFDNQEAYQKVKEAGVLNKTTIAQLYNLKETDIIASMYWDPAMAYKATIVRPATSGGFGETDTHGSQQHVPLMFIKCPFPRQ